MFGLGQGILKFTNNLKVNTVVKFTVICKTILHFNSISFFFKLFVNLRWPILGRNISCYLTEQNLSCLDGYQLYALSYGNVPSHSVQAQNLLNR